MASFNFSGLFSGLSTAISSGNAASALTAVTNLQSALGTSNATKQQVAMLTMQYEMAQAATPMNLVTMTAVLQSLVALVPTLPAADGPLIQQLGTPAIEESPAAASGVIAQIQQSLISRAL